MKRRLAGIALLGICGALAINPRMKPLAFHYNWYHNGTKEHFDLQPDSTGSWTFNLERFAFRSPGTGYVIEFKLSRKVSEQEIDEFWSQLRANGFPNDDDRLGVMNHQIHELDVETTLGTQRLQATFHLNDEERTIISVVHSFLQQQAPQASP